jgi:adenosylcobinamide-GDP ribazoletransferase
MKNFYLGLKFSLSYFSVLPINFKESDDLSKKEVLNVMLLFLPFVGLLLGLGTIVLFSFLSHLDWYGALFSAIFYMMLYGFLHTEAIIDVFDALYASHSGKDAYTIIKEPTVGAVGVLYGVSFLLLKVAGMVLLFTHHILAEFLAIVIISRLSLLTLLVLHDFKSSFLEQLKEALDLWSLMILFLFFMIMGSFLTPYFIILLLMGVIFGFFISIFFTKKLKFINGDVLGATLEGVEILLFLVVALFMVKS